VRPRAPRGREPGRGREIHRQHHVLGDRQRRQQLEELEHDAHAAPAPRRELVVVQLVDAATGHGDAAGGGVVEPGDQVQERRLAAARAADDGHELARAHVEVDPGERVEAAGRGDERAAQSAEGDHEGPFEG
jgi:hypothetical protein